MRCALTTMQPIARLYRRLPWSRAPLATRGMARVWRPSIDDVDRLSRGEGAKKRGTGNGNIPHRLNAQERPVYESAKKKGFLAVKGSAQRYRGAPLPNVYRQWCDAQGAPCIVIEQAVQGGSSTDVVVLDLATLRLLDTSWVAQLCSDIAARQDARELTAAEREPGDVPFDVIPAKAFRVAADEAAASISAAGRSSSSRSSSSSEAVSAADVAAAEEEVRAVGERVRQLKASGLGNTSSEVQAQVQVLLSKKSALQALQDAYASQQSLGSKDCASAESTSDGVARTSPEHSPPQAATSSSSSSSSEPPTATGHVTPSGAEAQGSSRGLRRRRQTLDEDHPYAMCAIWQIPAQPLFYEAERAAAKALAKELSVALCAEMAALK